MADGPKELRIYSTADGKKPFQEWIESLTDHPPGVVGVKLLSVKT